MRALALPAAALLLAAAPVAGQEALPPGDAAAPAPTEAEIPAPPPGPSPEAPSPAAAAEDGPSPTTIERVAEGGVRLGGSAPTRAAEAAMLARARAVAGRAAVESRLTIAGELPPRDWTRLTGQALSALGRLVSGTATIGPAGARIEGLAEDPPAREAALEELTAPEWRAEIEVQLALADPYTFTAVKTEADLTYAGHAPDDATAASLTSAVEDVAGAGAEGALTPARGMPGEDWPQLVRAGLVALMTADRGRLQIEEREVSLTAEVADAGAQRRLAEQLGTGWKVDLTIRDPAPAPELALTLGEQGLTAAGRLPEALGIEPLTDMLGQVDTSAGLSADAYGEAAVWRDAMDALAIAVPRMQEGSIRVADGSARFRGVLKDGFSANELRSALRATLGSEWEIALEIGESPPPSQIEIVRTPDGLDIDGILPDGVRPEQILGAFGSPDTRDVSNGGEGDRWAWRRQLRRAARALRVFETGSARIEGRTVALGGTLQPGYAADEVAAWLGRRLDEGWEVTVEAEDRPGAEGDRRASLDGEGAEVLRQGRWLPVYEFEVSPGRCDGMLVEAADGRRITFVPGSSEISDGQERLLDRLAGVIRRCVAGSELELEVQGHTDGQGEAAENLLLSEARAIEVVLELAERGVPASRLEPVGYGETRPLADNDTESGRASNRRISFAWRE